MTLAMQAQTSTKSSGVPTRAMIAPASAGPRTRAMFGDTVPSAMAAAVCPGGACSMVHASQADMLRALAEPRAKV